MIKHVVLLSFAANVSEEKLIAHLKSWVICVKRNSSD